MIESMEEATIDTLINEFARQWNYEIIDGIFAPEEAKLSKENPLAKMELNDSLFWPLTQDGSYTCKSGHHFLREEAKILILVDEVN